MASTPDRVSVRDALSPGTRLDEFEIVRVLGTGGFGIVYLARDHVLLRDVAIKEYMPAALAARGQDLSVSLRSPGFADTFAKGLDSFLSEARLLASFDHRSLVRVHRFWRSNATAYMAMQYYSGQTLRDARLRMSAPPDEAWLDAFIQALLGVLELLHGQGVYHRDISPDNILVLDDGRPVLLDFGSARRVMVDSAQSFTAHLKPQFAPIEQYTEESGGMRQGPWTDLYALGATLYFVLTGRAPTPSVVRAVRDVLPTLAAQAGTTVPSVRASMLATIDWTLALAPEQRPQDVLSVRRALSGELTPPPPSPRQLGAPLPAGNADGTAAPGLPIATSGGRAEPRARGGFSRLAATFWAPSTDAESKPSLSRRRARLGIAGSLALTGIVALGWGAWSFDRPATPPSAPSVPVAGGAAATATTVVATSVVAPTATKAPETVAANDAAALPVDAPATMPLTGPALRSATIDTASPVPSGTSLDLPAPAPPADAVSLRTAPGRQASAAGSVVAAEAVSTAPQRPTVVASTAPQAARSAPRDRQRTARPKVQTASAAARVSAPAKNACESSGLLSRTWCALNPCKASRGRANPECIERLRAEAARQQRVDRQ